MKELAKIMQKGNRFQKKKIGIGSEMIASYNTMREQRDYCNNLHNKVIWNSVSKANIEDLGVILSEFLDEEPDDDEVIAMRVLYWNLPFDNGVGDPDVIRHMTEADQDNPDVALWINTNVKYDIPLLVNLYDEAMENYRDWRRKKPTKLLPDWWLT